MTNIRRLLTFLLIANSLAACNGSKEPSIDLEDSIPNSGSPNDNDQGVINDPYPTIPTPQITPPTQPTSEPTYQPVPQPTQGTPTTPTTPTSPTTPTTPASPIPAPINPPPIETPPANTNEQVTVYLDCNFEGASAELGEGDHDFRALESLGIPNNRISSIKVPNGYTVTLYNGFKFNGGIRIKTSDSACLIDDDFDNVTSAINIARDQTPNEQDQIDIHAIDFLVAKNTYNKACAGCHGEDGNGLIRAINIDNCSQTNCRDVNVLAEYIAQTMAPANPNACDLSGADINASCAAMSAAYIANNFTGLNDSEAPVIPNDDDGLTPLARLTNTEFVNSAKTLLNLNENSQEIDSAIDTLAAESDVAGLNNDASTQILTQLAISSYLNLSTALSNKFFDGITTGQQMRNVMACSALRVERGVEPGAIYALDTCARDFSESLLKKAFRRELTALDTNDINTLFSKVNDNLTSSGQNSGNVASYVSRVSAVIQYALLSPDFLLIIEKGSKSDNDQGAQSLSSQEIANRLAFFITGNLPDLRLQEAADAGELLDSNSRLAHVDRLLDSPLAEQQVTKIISQWMSIKTDASDQDSVNTFTQFIANWYSHEKPFSDLYQAPIEVAHVDGSQSEQALGALGLKAFVAAHTSFPTPSFITRGVFVVERLLCSKLPDDIPAEALETQELTPIEVFEFHAQQECASCHRVFDNYGAAFQQFQAETNLFDPQNTDFGLDFDLFDIGDVSGDISDLEGLSTEMGLSQQAPACMSELWYRHAMRRSHNLNGVDAQRLNSIIENWESSGTMSMKALLRHIAASDTFISLFL